MGTIDILLIEDNPHDAEMIIAVLKENNITGGIRVLRDGAEALEGLFGPEGNQTGLAPRVVILDLKLPKLNGHEILKKIRSDKRTCCVPVVILTSSNEERDRTESYRLGVNSYIVKPVDYENFSRVVSEIGRYWVMLNRPPY